MVNKQELEEVLQQIMDTFEDNPSNCVKTYTSSSGKEFEISKYDIDCFSRMGHMKKEYIRCILNAQNMKF